MIRWLFISAILLIFQFARADDYLPSARYSISEGLSGNEITSLVVSPDDYLWIATTNGLNRFNGYSFTSFTSDPGDTNSIPNDKILSIKSDSNGNIFGITSNTLFRIDNKNYSISTYFNTNEFKGYDKLLSISDLYVFKDTVFVIGNNFLGCVDIKNRKIRNYIDQSIFDDFKALNLKSVCQISASGELLLNSTNRIFIFDPVNPVFRSIASSIIQDINTDEGLIDIIPGAKNDYYIYTKYRIWKLEFPSENVKLLYESKKSSGNNIVSIKSDISGCLKILFNNKIVNLDLNKSQSIDLFNFSPTQIHNSNISSFSIDSSGILWLGTEDGLIKFNPHKHIFRILNRSNLPFSDLLLKKSWAGFIDSTTGLLISSTGSTFKFSKYDENKYPDIYNFRKVNSQINSIDNSETGNFLLSTKKGLIIWRDFSPQGNRFKTEKVLYSDKEIYAACFDFSDTVWFAADSGIYRTGLNEFELSQVPELSKLISGQEVISMVCGKKFLWIQQNHRIIEFNRNTGGTSIINFANNKLPVIHCFTPFKNNQIYIGTSDGMFHYTADDRKLELVDPAFRLYSACIYSVVKTHENKLWASTDRGLVLFDPQTGKERLYDETDGLDINKFNERFSAQSNTGIILFGGSDGIVFFHPDSVTVNRHIPKVVITEISKLNSNGIQTFLWENSDTLKIDYFKNQIRITFAALDYWDSKKNHYLYSLVKSGTPKNWQNNGDKNYIDIHGLKPGYYTLSIKGMNSDGFWNDQPKDIVIRVTQTFWRTKSAFIIYLLFAGLLFYLSIVFRTKHFRNLNRKFKEREYISKQIQLQKDELSAKNKNITDSINYAKRIQMAMMPSEKIFRKLFNDSFILHLPKDIVSGDFYWVSEVDDRIFFAAVDCTGHGVPGAFMSIIGFELFRRITETDKKRQPAIILDNLSLGFEKIFRDVENYTLRDGMDVAFCAVDKELKVLEFAGAFNPMYLIRDNTITEIKGDRFSVGLNVEGYECHFKNNVIQLAKGDIIYIFTDGFADQFGGPEGKKYKYRRFRHLLLALHQLPMERQAEFLKRSINDWRGESDQVDDILVMGIRIN